ncbi:KTSC domain-containing protein [Microvirga lupini]|uniref:KTSC domain-containing protein n=1 Tax=Microvirga lupini TaxID=420324 RepID=UPI001615E240
MPYVSSSAISRIEHDPVTLKLYITFHGTGTYTYYGVPRTVYEAFLRASSKGQFYNDRIKDRYSSAR